MATNDMNERLCARLVGLEADVIANFPPSDRERLIDWPLCRRLNEMIASANERPDAYSVRRKPQGTGHPLVEEAYVWRSTSLPGVT